MLNDSQRERYSRQILLQNFGEKGQEKIIRSKCLVVGLGGLGSVISLYLTAAGVGTIGLMDNDIVSISNLQRQILYREKQTGQAKAVVAAQNLKELNSNCIFKSYDCFLNEENAEKIIAEYDLVMDATDNFKARYLIDEMCSRLGKPFVYCSISETSGQVSFFEPGVGKASYRSLFPDKDKLNEQENISKAVIGTLPALAASIATNEAIRYLVSGKSELRDKLLCFDLATNDFQIFEL